MSSSKVTDAPAASEHKASGGSSSSGSGSAGGAGAGGGSDHYDNYGISSDKEYQSLFWVPMLYQTSETAIALVESMLGEIEEFYEASPAASRKSLLTGSMASEEKNAGPRKRKQQILGDDSLGNEVVATRVEVVTKSDDTIFALLSVLKQHFLFSKLHDYELEDVIDSMMDEEFEEGDDIMAQGEAGDKFYVLEEGTVDILINNNVVATLNQGSSFGDLALMYNSPRAATIRAATECTCWTLEKKFFRQAMVTSSSNQTGNLASFLGKLKLFESLNMESLSHLAKSLTLKTYGDEDYIIKQGEIGEQFFVIYKGKVLITKTGDDGIEVPLITLGEGNVFGERALIKKEPRAANVIAIGSAECYSLAKDDFANLLGGIVEQMNELNTVRILRSSPTFVDVTDRSLTILRDTGKFKNHEMFNGQRMLCDSQHIFVVLDGYVSSPDGILYKVGNSVGSLTILADSEAASVTCKSDEAVVAIIARSAITDQIKEQEEYLASGAGDENADGNDATDSQKHVSDPDAEALVQLRTNFDKRKEIALERIEHTHEYVCKNLLDLDLLRGLGQGTFGNVFLAKQKITGKQFALKCLDKEVLVNASQSLYVKRECECLHHMYHPFIVQYYGVYITPRKVLFAMEFVPGGELWNYLYDSKHDRGPCGGLTVNTVMLYSAMVCLALEHIHGLGYCYRDLKSENLLIDSYGYIKIIDFGFAKSVPFFNKSGDIQYRTFTLCGTPDYMAPEVVLTQGHDKTADYWAFGVLLYEMLCGGTPFESITQKRTFEKIVNSAKFLTFPTNFDSHFKSLIRRLMHPKASLRIGALQNGFNDLKEHAVYNNSAIGKTDFDSLAKFQMTMPYIPEQKSAHEAVETHENERTAEQMAEAFEQGMITKMPLLNLEEEVGIENDINEELFQELIDIEELGVLG